MSSMSLIGLATIEMEVSEKFWTRDIRLTFRVIRSITLVNLAIDSHLANEAVGIDIWERSKNRNNERGERLHFVLSRTSSDNAL